MKANSLKKLLLAQKLILIKRGIKPKEHYLFTANLGKSQTGQNSRISIPCEEVKQMNFESLEDRRHL